MWFKFLGTSAGAPTKTRHVTGLALGVQGTKRWVLVDCGDGTQYRVMQSGLSLAQLQAICITHVHGDHCFGLPALLASAGMMGRVDPLLIVGPAELEDWLKRTLSFGDSHVNFPINFVCFDGSQSLPTLRDFSLATVALSHRVPCFGYVFEGHPPVRKLDKDKLKALNVPRGPLWGQLQHGEAIRLPTGALIEPETVLLPAEPPQKVLVGGDNDRPECFEVAAEHAQVMIHEATYTAEVAHRIGPLPQHSSAQQVAQFAQRVGLPNLVLTHFSPRYREPNVEGKPVASTHKLSDIRQEAERFYHGRLFLAEDLAHFSLDAQGLLQRVD